MDIPVAVHAQAVAQRASEVLMEAARGQSERVSVGEIVAALHGRAFGMAALVFALPACVPMPPGVPTIVGLAIALVSAQMVFGRRRLWLPPFLSGKTFSRAWLVNALVKVRPRLQWFERVARPRWLVLTGPLGSRLVGALLLLLAVMLILPIPIIGNFPLAMAAAVLSLGLIERDGRLVVAGVAASALAVAITGSMGWIALKAIFHFV
jgi:hypothetical protein